LTRLSTLSLHDALPISVNPMLEQFYARLLTVLRRPEVRDGRWQLLDCRPAWDGNWTSDCFVAFAWQGSHGERLVVTVNYSPNQRDRKSTRLNSSHDQIS